jgi:hypothetical protein
MRLPIVFRSAQYRFDWALEITDSGQEGARVGYLPVAITAACPDWRSVASLAVNAVSSAHSKRAYAKALKDGSGANPECGGGPSGRLVVDR